MIIFLKTGITLGEAVKTLLQHYVKVNNVSTPKYPNGASQGFFYATFMTEHDMDKAVRNGGYYCHGVWLTMEKSTSQKNQRQAGRRAYNKFLKLSTLESALKRLGNKFEGKSFEFLDKGNEFGAHERRCCKTYLLRFIQKNVRPTRHEEGSSTSQGRRDVSGRGPQPMAEFDSETDSE